MDDEQWTHQRWDQEWRKTVDLLNSTPGDPRQFGYGSALNRLSAEPYETLSILRDLARETLAFIEEEAKGLRLRLPPVRWDMLPIERRILSHEREEMLLKGPPLRFMPGYARWRQDMSTIENLIWRYEVAERRRAKLGCLKCGWPAAKPLPPDA